MPAEDDIIIAREVRNAFGPSVNCYYDMYENMVCTIDDAEARSIIKSYYDGTSATIKVNYADYFPATDALVVSISAHSDTPIKLSKYNPEYVRLAGVRADFPRAFLDLTVDKHILMAKVIDNVEKSLRDDTSVKYASCFFKSVWDPQMYCTLLVNRNISDSSVMNMTRRAIEGAFKSDDVISFFDTHNVIASKYHKYLDPHCRKLDYRDRYASVRNATTLEYTAVCEDALHLHRK